ncbi:LemA family protein [soil metagenome]
MFGPTRSGETSYRRYMPLLVIGGLILVLGLFGVSRYNALVAKRETVDNSWAQVQNVLQRRADLIPNLVATVKGYAAHEKEVFEHVADARAKLAGAKTPAEASAANSQLDGALSRLLVVVESYPQLKANENFIRLQDELAGTENRISVERMRYNDVVRDYNQTIKRFPTSLFAGMTGFSAKDYFEADAKAQNAPEVRF